MDKELKTRWIEALRSGKYKQGNGMLRGKDNRFCCLGVLCDIFDSEEWRLTDDGQRYTYGNNVYSCVPSPEISERMSGQPFPAEYITLVDMNDQCKTFAEIADWIEKNL